MEKNKKKAVSGTPKSPKRLSEYKTREAESTANKNDVAFQKIFGKRKDSTHKG